MRILAYLGVCPGNEESVTIQYEKLRQILRFWELDDIADDQLKKFANQLQEAIDEKKQPSLGSGYCQNPNCSFSELHWHSMAEDPDRPGNYITTTHWAGHKDEKNQPNLGLATTQQLIDELRARWDVAHIGKTDSHPAFVLQDIEDLFRRDGSLDYRTVDG